MNIKAKIYKHFQKNKYKHLLLGIIFLAFIFLAFQLLSKNKFQEQTPGVMQPSVRIKATPDSKRYRIEGQLIIKFKQGVTTEQIERDLIRYNAKIIGTIPQIYRMVIQVPKDQTDAILARLAKDKLIENAEADYYVHGAFPNDPEYKKQWYLKNIGQIPNYPNQTGISGDDINIEQAWMVTHGNAVRIADINTGIDLKHEDLQEKVIAQQSFVEGVTSVQDDHGHGTFVAGIMAANGNNGIGVAGVCPECKLIIAKSLNKDDFGAWSDIAKGITWATDQGAQIINLSLGAETSNQTVSDGINYALKKNVLVVAAAGNCGSADLQTTGCQAQNPVIYPAALPGVISVAATDNRDQPYTYSETGTWITMAAPGTGIFSTKLIKSDGQKYAYATGTSASSPIVSGALALLLSTGLSRDQAIQRLCDTSDNIAGTGSLWKCGRINVGRAVASVVPTQLVPVPTTIIPTLVPSTLPTEVLLPTVPTNNDQINPTCAFYTLGGSNCVPTQAQINQATPTLTVIVPTPLNPNPNPSGGLLSFLISLISVLLSLLEIR